MPPPDNTDKRVKGADYRGLIDGFMAIMLWLPGHADPLYNIDIRIGETSWIGCIITVQENESIFRTLFNFTYADYCELPAIIRIYDVPGRLP